MRARIEPVGALDRIREVQVGGVGELRSLQDGVEQAFRSASDEMTERHLRNVLQRIDRIQKGEYGDED